AWLANFAQQYSFTVDELLEACRHVWGAEHDEQALELALVGQASAVIPALAVSLDYPEPEHRKLTRRKLRWWSEAARRGARRPGYRIRQGRLSAWHRALEKKSYGGRKNRASGSLGRPSDPRFAGS